MQQVRVLTKHKKSTRITRPRGLIIMGKVNGIKLELESNVSPMLPSKVVCLGSREHSQTKKFLITASKICNWASNRK